MAGLLSKPIVVKKTKKHGNKSGRKTNIRPSEKKSVKNGRHQDKELPKQKLSRVGVKNALKALAPTLEGPVLDDGEPLDHLEEFDGYLSTLDCTPDDGIIETDVPDFEDNIEND